MYIQPNIPSNLTSTWSFIEITVCILYLSFFYLFWFRKLSWRLLLDSWKIYLGISIRFISRLLFRILEVTDFVV